MLTNYRKVRRTVTLSACIGQRLSELGEFEDYQDILIGDYTPEKATRTLRRIHSDQTITIVRVEQETGTYEMKIEDFIETANRID